jgi:rod shape determining protein RodA
MIFFQSAVNIAVNVGLMPVTGLTLPLVSYGGSSLWATLVGIGLVESVVIHHRRLDFAD